MAFKGNITFTSGKILLVSNHLRIGVQEGGAITLFQSNAFFYGVCRLECNHAENGGAILSIDSKIFMSGSNVSIAHNKASESGGGV